MLQALYLIYLKKCYIFFILKTNTTDCQKSKILQNHILLLTLGTIYNGFLRVLIFNLYIYIVLIFRISLEKQRHHNVLDYLKENTVAYSVDGSKSRESRLKPGVYQLLLIRLTESRKPNFIISLNASFCSLSLTRLGIPNIGVSKKYLKVYMHINEC